MDLKNLTRPVKQCAHGLGDDVDVENVVTIAGRVRGYKVYRYYCHQHDQHGTFTMETPKTKTPSGK